MHLSGRQHRAPSFSLWSPAPQGFDSAWHLLSNIKPRHLPFCQQWCMILEENNLIQEITGSSFQVPFKYVLNYSPQLHSCNGLWFVFLCSQSSRALATLTFNEKLFDIESFLQQYYSLHNSVWLQSTSHLISTYWLWKNDLARFLLPFFYWFLFWKGFIAFTHEIAIRERGNITEQLFYLLLHQPV